MVRIKPFRGIRPPKKFVEDVECRPYDVLASNEAKEEAGDNEKSLYHIIKPEINFQANVSEYDSCVYEESAKQFSKFLNNQWLKKDVSPHYYLYAQSMNGATQYGFVVCCDIHDYVEQRIKIHEFTREKKEQDRYKHILSTNANIEPVFLVYNESRVLEQITRKYIQQQPEYDFTATIDGFQHTLWIIDDSDIDCITEAFSEIPHLYIADGHHRTAAAVKVGLEKQKANGEHTGKEEYNYFMAVCFPKHHLSVLDYNRVVKDLNGLSAEEFVQQLSTCFEIEKQGNVAYKPSCEHEFALYLEAAWYKLVLRDKYRNSGNIISSLDVSVLSSLVFNDILGIFDLRNDDRIDFVGGLRGLDELERIVDSGKMKAAFALYPIDIEKIINIADHHLILPPKATWFEPKLRSGLIIHDLNE